jgi:hypothetical protein
MTDEMSKKIDAEIARLIAETGKLVAESGKLNAEAAKLQTERWWYPAVVGAGFMAGAIAASAAFIRLLLP